MLDKHEDLSRDAWYPQKADEVAQGAGELETGRPQRSTKHHETLSQKPWWRESKKEIKYLFLAFADTHSCTGIHRRKRERNVQG